MATATADEREARAARERASRERRRHFCGIDGEGVTLPDGRHAYVLLQASDGSILEEPEGLKTGAILAWLIALGKRERTIVGFGLDYDVNKWLVDLPEESLALLADGEPADFPYKGRWYRIRWAPHHHVTVSVGKRFRHETDPPREWFKSEQAVTIWDTFGLFGCSFLRALETWGVGLPEEMQFLRFMKEQRERFHLGELPTLREYNALECQLLAEMLQKVKGALAERGIRLKRWDGYGAVASELLRAHAVPKPAEALYGDHDLFRQGYYGGRVQALQLGAFPGPVYHYDLTAAYPWVMSQLPRLEGTWMRVDWGAERSADLPTMEETARTEPLALWHVSWQVGGWRNKHYPLTPFPWRDERRRIHYPTKGSGWYWSPLVREALRHWPNGIRVLEGFVFRPEPGEPFAWMRERYEERRAMQAAGNPAAALLKGGMAAVYGKLAQSVGYAGAPPPYRSWVWAGLTTAAIQARVLRLAMRDPRNVIAFATDGFFCRRRILDQPELPGLGAWREETCDGLVLWQPGVYATRHGDRWSLQTRGFRRGELSAEDLVRGDLHTAIEVEVRRFLGLKLARHLGRLPEWGQWITLPRTLNPHPENGFPDRRKRAPVAEGAVRWMSEEPSYRLAESTPYVPKSERLDLEYDAMADLVMLLDQPDPLEEA